MGGSAKVEPVTDTDEGELTAEFAQCAQAIGQNATKIAALESEVSELRSSNQALELAQSELNRRGAVCTEGVSPSGAPTGRHASATRPAQKPASCLPSEAPSFCRLLRRCRRAGLGREQGVSAAYLLSPWR